MKRLIQSAALLLLLSTLHPQFSTALAQGTAFTYQGRLNDGAAPANGSYDLRFVLYDSSVGGSQQGPILTNAPTAVSNGLFTVALDFGNVFPGTNRWLEIAARTNGGGTFTTLSPRQLLTPTPYAITAENVAPGAGLSGTYGNAVTFSNSANIFSGGFNGNGGGLTNVNAATLGGLASGSFWQLGGNTASPGQFVGSLNNQPLELRANGMRGLRLEPTATDANHSSIVNVIGGSPANFVTPGVYGATIAGGGAQNYTGFSSSNSVASDFGVVGGGGQNQVQSNAFSSTVGGGFNNVIQIGAKDTTISGGNNNLIQSNAAFSTIGGGAFNYIYTNAMEAVISGGIGNGILNDANDSTISGGENNFIQTNAYKSTISGGYQNIIENNANDSSISGGQGNQILGSAVGSAIGGGSNNLVNARGVFSTIGGGHDNTAQGAFVSIGGGQNNLAFALAGTISGGSSNIINAAMYTTISGGQNNYISNNADYATVAGGGLNLAGAGGDSVSGGEQNAAFGGNSSVSGGLLNQASGTGSSVGGGEFNHATGGFAVVPGGTLNYAEGANSFAAGNGATAINDYTFVWNDGPSFFPSSAPNQFLIHAAGGVGIGTNAPAAALHVASSGDYTFPQAQITQQNTGDGCRLRMHVFGHPFWEMQVTSDASAPQLQFYLSNQSGTRMRIDASGNVYATSFNPSSDRNIKENFSTVSPQEVLDKVAALPITRWSFKQDKEVEHLGPMAQDFRAAFGLGTDDKHIATVDEEGVALAAIQGLNQKLEQKETEITELKQNVAELKKMLQLLAEKK